MLLAIPAVVGLEIVQVRNLPEVVGDQLAEVLCEAMHARTGHRTSTCGGPAITADRVEIRMFGGPTRVLLAARRVVGTTEHAASVELELDRPETWRATAAELLAVVVEAQSAPRPQRLGLTEQHPDAEWGPARWSLVGTGGVAVGLGLAFCVLGAVAQGRLSDGRFVGQEYHSLVDEVERDRHVAVAMIAVGTLSLVALVAIAGLE